MPRKEPIRSELPAAAVRIFKPGDLVAYRHHHEGKLGIVVRTPTCPGGINGQCGVVHCLGGCAPGWLESESVEIDLLIYIQHDDSSQRNIDLEELFRDHGV